jgi:hypothetical protein
VDLRDGQPMKHEIGKRTYIVADVEPLDVDGVRTVEVGTLAWLILAGFGLGLFGLEYCRRRRRARSTRGEAPE